MSVDTKIAFAAAGVNNKIMLTIDSLYNLVALCEKSEEKHLASNWRTVRDALIVLNETHVTSYYEETMGQSRKAVVDLLEGLTNVG